MLEHAIRRPPTQTPHRLPLTQWCALYSPYRSNGTPHEGEAIYAPYGRVALISSLPLINTFNYEITVLNLVT
jgi:hypothetical protein